MMSSMGSVGRRRDGAGEPIVNIDIVSLYMIGNVIIVRR